MAVEPGPALRNWLGRVITVLREARPGLRWARPENVHLTLKFLGDVDPDAVGELLAVIESIARDRKSPLVVPFGDFGQFGGARAPGILWLGLQPGPQRNDLTAFQAALERELLALGIPAEPRPWKPHLTLARNPRHRKVGDWRLLARHAAESPPALEVRECTLFRSDLSTEGPRYQVLGKAPLGTGAARDDDPRGGESSPG